MTDFNAPDRDLNRAIRSWLHQDRHEDVSRVAGAVLDQVETIPQRRAAWWPAWRTPIMNRFVTFGVGAAAVVAVVLVGAQLFGRPNNSPGAGNSTPTEQPTTKPTPSPDLGAGLPEGEFVLNDGQLVITVNIASSGWIADAEDDYMYKDDDGLDAPESVGTALLAGAWPAGTGFNVYQDPCHWQTSIPKKPATTPDQIAAAFAAQASTDASPPVNVNVGGYAGKAVTLHVPISFHIPNASREEEFADCDANRFAFYGIEGEDGEARNAQGPGQIDELWILDVNGSIVILDVAYSPATPANLVEETRTLAESATFEAR